MDPTLACMRKRAEEGKDEYRWHQGVLVQEEMDELGDLVRKVVLPKSRRNQVLMLAHRLPGAGHFGYHKNHARLNSYFTWPGMRPEIAGSCRGCQLASPDKNPRAPLKPLPCIGQPIELLAMDLVGPIERTQRVHKYIMTAMCLFLNIQRHSL